MTHIKNDLAAMRKALDLTQGQLAERAGVSRETVSKVETGAVDPQLSTLIELARAMDLEFMVVPRALRIELEAFVRAGGRWLAQPPGVDAPPSVVDLLLSGK
ncbi:helix-turn-helix transcriptional regulator [Roseateles sp.]|uniref:helix-turn-helix transcriptional regulator n=1 Tax=Roseateles sp. TaxID=1971397 RepID=UPI0039E760E2